MFNTPPKLRDLSSGDSVIFVCPGRGTDEKGTVKSVDIINDRVFIAYDYAPNLQCSVPEGAIISIVQPPDAAKASTPKASTPVCECGLKSLGMDTGHSDWCPLSSER